MLLKVEAYMGRSCNRGKKNNLIENEVKCDYGKWWMEEKPVGKAEVFTIFKI